MLFCLEVGKPFLVQLCYDVNDMTLHQQAGEEQSNDKMHM
jgi:hypothetical protein